MTGTRDGDTIWSEWDWRGHHVDGSLFGMRGDEIAEGRLYPESVDHTESNIDDALKDLYEP